jgi:hypothetical protein
VRNRAPRWPRLSLSHGAQSIPSQTKCPWQALARQLQVRIATGVYFMTENGRRMVLAGSDQPSAATRGKGLGGALRPRLPVARPPLSMSDSKYFDFVVADSIDRAERKARKQIATCKSTIPRPTFRIVGHRIDGRLSSSRKPRAAAKLRAAYQSYAAMTSRAASG